MYEDLDELDEIFGDLDMRMLHTGEKHRVFVYGTLMSGMRNHSRLETNGVKLLDADASTFHSHLRMLSRVTSTGYAAPIVIDDAEADVMGIIGGEVYEVSNSVLIMLDQLEGHPDVYERTKVPIDCNGFVGPIWMYLYADRVTDGYGMDGVEYTKRVTSAFGNYRLYEWRGL